MSTQRKISVIATQAVEWSVVYVVLALEIAMYSLGKYMEAIPGNSALLTALMEDLVSFVSSQLLSWTQELNLLMIFELRHTCSRLGLRKPPNSDNSHLDLGLIGNIRNFNDGGERICLILRDK